jgi:hypothetical protein
MERLREGREAAILLGFARDKNPLRRTPFREKREFHHDGK